MQWKSWLNSKQGLLWLEVGSGIINHFDQCVRALLKMMMMMFHRGARSSCLFDRNLQNGKFLCYIGGGKFVTDRRTKKAIFGGYISSDKN